MLSAYRIARTAREAGQVLDDLKRDVEGRNVPVHELAETIARVRVLTATVEQNADEISRKLRDIADS